MSLGFWLATPDGAFSKREYQSPCGVQVKLDTKEHGHYREITPGHCEGRIIGLRNDRYLVLIAVDHGERTMTPNEDGILSIRWPAFPSTIKTAETIHLKAIDRKHKLAYRLDAIQPLTQGRFDWNIRQARAFDKELRFVPLATVEVSGEEFRVPLQVGPGVAGCYQFEFLAGIPIDSYGYLVKSFPTYQEVASLEAQKRHIKKDRSLRLELCQDQLGAAGLYQLEVTITYSDRGKAKKESTYPIRFLHGAEGSRNE